MGSRARARRGSRSRRCSPHCRFAANTEFGRSHDLASMRSYHDFCARVPLRTYADFEPQLDRMRAGVHDVLWPGLVRYFGNSSGTSHTRANSKFLPISDQQVRWQQKAGFDCLSRYLVTYEDRSFTGGFILALMPPSNLKREGDVFTASNPGIMQLHAPAITRAIVLPKPDVRDIENYDQKLQAIAESYLDHDVRALTGTTCWFSILFDRVLEAARARGRRASVVADVWPNLRVLLGGGVFAEPYRPLIEERYGRPIPIIDTYNATEGGIFATSDRRDDDAMLILPDRGVFFEFVERSEHGNANARRVPLWEVVPGVDYSIAVTTSSGLFGYYIGDFVRFTSVLPHRMVFAGRASGMLSITQELTTQIEIERAVASGPADRSVLDRRLLGRLRGRERHHRQRALPVLHGVRARADGSRRVRDRARSRPVHAESRVPRASRARCRDPRAQGRPARPWRDRTVHGGARSFERPAEVSEDCRRSPTRSACGVFAQEPASR